MTAEPPEQADTSGPIGPGYAKRPRPIREVRAEQEARRQRALRYWVQDMMSYAAAGRKAGYADRVTSRRAIMTALRRLDFRAAADELVIGDDEQRSRENDSPYRRRVREAINAEYAAGAQDWWDAMSAAMVKVAPYSQDGHR